MKIILCANTGWYWPNFRVSINRALQGPAHEMLLNHSTAIHALAVGVDESRRTYFACVLWRVVL